MTTTLDDDEKLFSEKCLNCVCNALQKRYQALNYSQDMSINWPYLLLNYLLFPETWRTFPSHYILLCCLMISFLTTLDGSAVDKVWLMTFLRFFFCINTVIVVHLKHELVAVWSYIITVVYKNLYFPSTYPCLLQLYSMKSNKRWLH